MQNPTNIHRPRLGALPFNNLPGPISPKEALNLPGDNIFKRMYWASIMFVVALKAEASKQITGMVIEQNALEAAIEKEMMVHKQHHKRKGHVGRQDGGPGHEEGFDAGELDQFDNGPELPEMYKNHEESTTHWLVRIIRMYYMSFVLVYNMLGLKRDEEGELTDKALDDWLISNEKNLEFQHLKMHLLNSLSEHSREFDLTQIQFAQRFLDRLSATLFINGKTLHDLQAVNQQELGKAVATAFSHQLKEMSALTHEMVQQTTNALSAAGVNIKPAVPGPTLTPASLNKAVAAMGPAPHPADQGQQLAMERIATVSSMFPKVPKPQNAQTRKHATHSKKDIAPTNTSAAMGSELEQYANAIGVDPRILEQGADHTRLKIMGQDGPEHAAGRSAMRGITAFPNAQVNAPAKNSQSLVGKLMQAMKPAPRSSRES